jgi:hypothetical protein
MACWHHFIAVSCRAVPCIPSENPCMSLVQAAALLLATKAFPNAPLCNTATLCHVGSDIQKEKVVGLAGAQCSLQRR